MQPPVRSLKESVTGSGSAAAAVKASSKGQPSAPAAPGRSADLLTPSDQQLGEDTIKLPPSGTAPKAAAGIGASSVGLRQQQQQQGQGLIHEVEPRGSQRTQLLLEQNLQLGEVERHSVAEVARCRGNDLFRCGQYADAVEEYSLAIGLHPEQVACYTNRAAAYLKLKQWEYAVVDATSALNISTAQGEHVYKL
eukprot:GHUV01032415.1.p1 GENE.GHUV01032415.1~~GHUV01032415.1.p1  ORF type:complete len:194 (+),score=58.04 GHUV01032415.1:399-980(+)